MARQSNPGQTVIDYVTIALSPALIVGLVGSLVFFLLEVFYRQDGQWKDRLQLVLFAFVVGAVLVARISMMAEIASRFWIYGPILALLTYFALQKFVQYPAGVKEVSFFVNALLVAVVWWCAHRLTWDCTNVDEDTDMAAQGVLQAAGFEGAPPQQAPSEDKSLWQRWQEYQKRTSKKRTLGVWIVYFSLAALPIFGLGQSLIPLTAPGSRQFTFWLMAIYVGCGLGLLLTTCFLGLRRYLRQKRIQMPAAMTGTWLAMGGMLIVALLAIGAILPRPYAEYSLLDLVPAGAKKQQADRVALKGDSPGEGKGQPGAADPEGKELGNKTGKDGKSPGGKDKEGKAPGGEKEGKDGSKSADKAKDGDKPPPQDKAKSKDGVQAKAEQKDGNKQPDAQKGAKELEKAHQQQSPPSQALNSVQEFLRRIGPWLKWIVFGLLAVLVLVALLRGGLGWLANFSKWAKGLLEAWRAFWARLFGQRIEEATGEEITSVESHHSHTPFAAYANPFDSGRAEAMSQRQLVRYTFAALEAWAREHDLERRNDETAIEFAARLSEEVPTLGSEARKLAQLHARAEYASGALPAGTGDTLRAFWQRLERAALAPA